jgi:hypothetical protein
MAPYRGQRPIPTARQQDITMILDMCALLFNKYEAPPLPFVCAWLNQVEVGKVLETIEQCAEADKIQPMYNPWAWVWNKLRRSHPSPQREIDDIKTVRYDENGQRVTS